MEKTKQQITVSVECQQQIGILFEADRDSVSLKFDTEGRVTTSSKEPPTTVWAYDVAVFKRDATRGEKYRLCEYGYFSPDFDESVILSLHVTEIRRAVFYVTINAYRRATANKQGVDPQYLGSKVVQLGNVK